MRLDWTKMVKHFSKLMQKISLLVSDKQANKLVDSHAFLFFKYTDTLQSFGLLFEWNIFYLHYGVRKALKSTTAH